MIVVSEETGIVSICHRGRLERNFDPESFQRRLGELLLLAKDTKDSRPERKSLPGKAAVAIPGSGGGGDPKPRESDNLAF